MTATDTQRTIDAVWRIESARLIAGLARMVRDVGLAEDLAHDDHTHIREIIETRQGYGFAIQRG